MKIYKTNILNSIDPFNIEYKKSVFLHVNENGKITEISDKCDAEFSDFSNYLCIPGLIDLHVHLSQIHVRGKHSDNLLDWLNNYIFSEELKSKDKNYALKTAEYFYNMLLSSGTTTSVVYTSVFPQACDAAFEVAEKLGVRSIIGKVQMDQNSPDFLIEDTDKSMEESIKLFKKWNRKTDLLEYIFTPRFAPTCSSKMMKSIGDFAHENDTYIQTHLSENYNEIKWVEELYPECQDYTDVYFKHNILGPKTIMGHAIHLSQAEFDLLRKTETKVAHCPDSNFFLKSGAFHYEEMLKNEITFGLASDVGAGTSLSMFNVMKMCNYRQEEYIVSPPEALYYSTLGAAKVLGKENKIGLLKEGYEGDFIFIKVPDMEGKTKDDILSDLVYYGNELELDYTFIKGKCCFSSNKSGENNNEL